MIVRIKKRDLLIATVSLFLIALIPLVFAQTQTPQKAGFGVWIIISNQNPINITLNNATGFTVNPSASGSIEIIISFNASDPDGLGQINGTIGGKVTVNLTLGAPGVAQFRTQTTCTNSTEGGTASGKEVTFNCTINLQYYDNASSNWVINITVEDSNGGVGRNDSSDSESTPHTFIYNDLASFTLTAKHPGEGANLNFTSLNVGDQNQEAKAPLLLNNTGNNDFDQINITAADLTSSGTSDTIPATAFAVNVTNSSVIDPTEARGLALSTTAQVIPATVGAGIPNATLLHGPGISGDSVPYTGTADSLSKGNLSLIFWIDVPSSSLSAQTYNNTWNITVVDLS